jgi:hypothetical protein
MLSKRHALAVLCAATLVACDNVADITGPGTSSSPSPNLIPIPVETEFLPGIPLLDPFAPMWGDDGGVVESARGGGHFQTEGALRTFAFTAKTRADGTTQGQYQINNRSTGIKEHGVVTCLDVDDHTAWIGAMITHSNDPNRLGFPRVFQVVDRGEGSGSPPDQASFFDVRPAESCGLRLPQLLNDLEGGNIQVTDGA